MASKLIKGDVLKNICKRSYVAQAAAAVQHSYILPTEEPQVTTFPSGAVVASLENNAPVSRVAVLFKAGSRYEGVANSGATHMLRLSAGLATSNVTAFMITRSLQQKGGAFYCESGREHVSYGIDIIRDHLDHGLTITGEVVTNPTFKPWEVAEEKRRLLNELATRDSATMAVDLLHAAAFRSGLGNSIYVPAHRIGKVSVEQLHAFHASTHTSDKMAVVGLGVDHSTLVSYAEDLGIGSGSEAGAESAGKYSGGEIHVENGGPLAYVAIGGSGASIGSSDAASLVVAQHILGVGSGVKYGANSSSKLVPSGNGAAMAINVNYTDAGLFGYLVVADAASAGEVVKSVHNSLRNLKLTEDDVAHGRKMVKVALLMTAESAGETVADMGLQALLTGKYVTPSAAGAAIDSVTLQSVQSAISKALGGKLSMAAVGGLENVPYLDQL